MRYTLTIVLLILCNLQSFAAPPKLEIPAELKPTGDYVTHKPKTDAVSIIYVGLSGIDAFPSDFLKDSRDFILPTRGIPTGTYKFSAVGASATGEQLRQDFVVVIGKGTPPPVPVPIPDPPIPDPPSTAFYFLIVRSDGPADPAFTRLMSDPAWVELRKLGHTYKDKTLTEAAELGLSFADGIKLPVVVTLALNADGKKHRVVRDAIPIPANILDLPKGVK